MTSKEYWIQQWKSYFMRMDSPTYYVNYEEKIQLYEAEKTFQGVKAEGHKRYLSELRKKRA